MTWKISVMYCTLLKYKRKVVYGTSKVPYARLVPIEMQHARRYRKASQGIDQLALVIWHPTASDIGRGHKRELHRIRKKEQLHRWLPPMWNRHRRQKSKPKNHKCAPTRMDCIAAKEQRHQQVKAPWQHAIPQRLPWAKMNTVIYTYVILYIIYKRYVHTMKEEYIYMYMEAS